MILNFDKNISETNCKRHLTSSLRNVPDNWIQFNHVFNHTYEFIFVTNNMFKGDEDNLIKDTKYLDNFISYTKKNQGFQCKKSNFKLTQELNDQELFDIIIIIASIIILCNALTSCIENNYCSCNCKKSEYNNLNT